MNVDIQVEGISFIGGVNQYGAWLVKMDTVKVDQDIAVQQTTANFDVYIRGTVNGTSITWPITRPKAGQDVVFYNTVGGREFGGILLNVTEEEIQPNYMVYHCACGDYTKWFDRHLVNNTYQANITVQQLVSDIVQTYVNTPGNTRTFTTNNVQSYPTVPLPLLQFVYLPPSQVMGQIVQMLGWGWYIDFNRDINLFSTENFISPLPNNTLDVDDLFDNPSLPSSQYGNWVNFTIEEDVSQLKNQVYITGIYIADQALYTQNTVADGQTTTFTLNYEPPNDVSQITVAVNGVQQQIGLEFIDSTPGGTCEANTVYVNFSGQTARFCTAPPNGATVSITYYPLTATAVMQNNPQAQQYMASIDGTDGVYEYNRLDPSLSGELPTLATTRAQMTLTKYAYPVVSGTFTSWLGGWRVGQYFYLQTQRRMQGQYNGTKFFVTRVHKTIIQATSSGGWLFQYSITYCNIPFEV